MMALYDAMPLLLGGGEDFMTIANFGFAEPDPSVINFEADSFYLEAVSVLYAMFSGFLLFKGLDDLGELREALVEEATCIGSIEKYSDIILKCQETSDCKQLSNQLRDLLRDYVQRVIEFVKNGPTAENDVVISKATAVVVQIVPKTDVANNAQAAILNAFDELARARSRRSRAMGNRLPPMVMTFLLLMSISMVMPFFGAPVDGFSTNHIYIFLMTCCFTFVFMLLLDLNDPFDGYWQISMAPFEEIRRRLA
ncbi:hypothetical protein AIOL_002009 [Candidatus Rhodobacter oscarellae]|uniref:Uncharacterized protein n=2 Tax=Candidatus Rhodobacter oscarellae TaxID=1675527 RepID=A0A0J9E2G4_9RHOB|nr:hypothetical protein AIOL_002009 [Candidatus Rhodobacter lobularis]